MKPGAEWPAISFGAPGLAPVVLLHGFLGCGANWNAVATELATDHFILCPDLPGHGANTLNEAVAFEAVTAGLAEFLDHHGVTACALAGYSMGGRLAMHFALCHPERVSRLALESASPGIEDEHIRESRCLHDDNLAKELADLPDAAAFRAWLRQWYSAPLWESLHRHPGMVDALVGARSAFDPVSLGAGLHSMSVGRQPSLWRELPELACPTLLITGELDYKYGEIAERMAEVNPALATVTFTGCGHNVHLESTDAYTTVLRRFLGA